MSHLEGLVGRSRLGRSRAGAVLLFAGSGCVVCPSQPEPRIAGFVSDPRLDEISGVAAGDDGLWVHNDGPAGSVVHRISYDGVLLQSADLAAVAAVDVEDIAAEQRPDGAQVIVVADIGDNERQRSQVFTYAFVPSETGGTSDVPVTRVALRYPDGKARDAEALMIDPLQGDRYIWTKRSSGAPEVFRAPRGGLEHVLEPVDVPFQLASSDWGAITAADISPDRRWIAARDTARAWLWPMFSGQTIAQALSGQACELQLADDGQGEAITFFQGEVVTLSEGQTSPVWSYPWP